MGGNNWGKFLVVTENKAEKVETHLHFERSIDRRMVEDDGGIVRNGVEEV